MKKFLEKRGSTKTWETATQYALVHSVALLAVALSQKNDPRPSPSLDLAGKSFGTGAHSTRRRLSALLTLSAGVGSAAGGTLLFSGSLYGLCLGGPRLLGPVTPIGGLVLIWGWLCVGWSGFEGETKKPAA